MAVESSDRTRRTRAVNCRPEREFTEWFYAQATARRVAIASQNVDETLPTFAGVESVLGAVGVYRAALPSIEQTEPLARMLVGHKVKVPVVAFGGEKGFGKSVLAGVKLVAKHVEGGVIVNSGHFLPEERPDVVIAASGRCGTRSPRNEQASFSLRPHNH